MQADLTGSMDEELVAAARLNRREAFDELTRRYFGVVYSIGLARLKDRDRAEDLAQEVFLHSWLLLDRLSNPAIFSHWLTRMARNLAIDWQRRGNTATRLLPMIPMADVEQNIADEKSANPREATINAEQSAALYHVLDSLQPEQREVVLLHYLQGLSHREIATQLGVNQSTVSRHMERTLRGMRSTMDSVLREMAQGLRPRSVAQARAFAAAPAVLGLSAVTKASLAGTAARSVQAATAAAKAKAGAGAGILSFPASLFSAAKTGGVIMASSKAVATVVAAAVIGAGLYYRSHEHGTMTRPTAPATALNSTDAVVLKCAPPVGRRLVMRMESTMDTKTQLPDVLKGKIPVDNMDMGGSEVQDVAMTAKEIYPDGRRTIELETLASTFKVNNMPKAVMAAAVKNAPETDLNEPRPYMQAFVGRKLLAHVSTTGSVETIDGLKEASDTVQKDMSKITALMGGVSALDQFSEHYRRLISPTVFPSGAVKVGNSWSYKDTMQLSMAGTVMVDATNRFVGWKMLDGRKVAEIQMDSQVEGAPSVTMTKGMKARYDKQSSTGTYYFDPELGQVVQFVANSRMEFTMALPVVPVKLPSGGEIRMIIQSTTSQKIIEDSGKTQVAMK